MKFKKMLALLLSVALILSFVGCKQKGSNKGTSAEESSESVLEEYPVKIGDYTVWARPRHVVSLSPALTEKLYDLGMQDRLVGISNFCDWPAGTSGMTQCGTAMMPDLDAIIRQKAHMVISETPLPQEDQAKLEDLGIDVVVVPHAKSLEGLYDTYIALGRVMEGEYAGGEMGRGFVQGLRGWVESLRQSVSSFERKDALYIRMLPFVVATGDTLENDLLDVIGLNNIASGYSGWLVTEEDAKGDGRKQFESADMMFFDREELTIKDLEKSGYYKSLRATLKDLYLEIDSTVMERQSLRTFEQLLEMAAYAHPDAKLPAFQLDHSSNAGQEAPGGGDGDEAGGEERGVDDADEPDAGQEKP